MKCKNCGNHEIEEAKFCGKCGAPFSADHDAGNGKGPKSNEWAMRDYVYGWLSDGAGLIFGAFQLDESRNEEEKVTTFSVKLSGTPSQFTEEGEVWETIEVDDNPGEKIIQKKTVDDGRKLIFYVEVAESKDELLGHGQVVCFAYFAIPIDYSLYEPACVIAGKWNDGNLSCIQCFRDDESVVVRAKSFALLGEQQKDTLLDVLANDCLKVGYESWRDFEELSESSLGVDDDLIESGKNEGGDLIDIENLDKVVLEMTSQGANKAALAQYIYESMPNNSRAEVIDQFIKLAKLTPAGASTYYSNIKKKKNDDVFINESQGKIKSLIKLADLGDKKSQFNLALKYDAGTEVKKNKDLAIKYYEMAAQQGMSHAQNNLGLKYECGDGVEKDPALAFNYYTLAASQGLMDGQFNLAKCYLDGFGVDADDSKAFFWFKAVADQGDSVGQNIVAGFYIDGIGISENKDLAFSYYEKSANQGYAKAQFSLGVCYSNGIGIKRSDRLAFDWYKKSAEQGHVPAINNLSNCYFEGKGIAKNKKISFALDKEIVARYEKGEFDGELDDYGNALYRIALVYVGDDDLSEFKDGEKAFLFFKKSSEIGNIDAKVELGICYINGIGTNEDPIAAYQLFREAADQGNIPGKYNLALCYKNGFGVIRNNDYALTLFKEAASNGYADAYAELDELS